MSSASKYPPLRISLQVTAFAVAILCAACAPEKPAEADVTAPPGFRESPISPEIVADAGREISEIEPAGNALYWVESRPEEGGRGVVMRRTPDGAVVEFTQREYDVRTRLNEYGGGALTVLGEWLYFTNFSDQRLYVQPVSGGAPAPLTSAVDGRIGDCSADPRRGRLICLRESHEEGASLQSLVAVSIADGAVTELFRGPDFLASPRVSPDGAQVTFKSWALPGMPWDASHLWVAELKDDGAVGSVSLAPAMSGEAPTDPVWIGPGEFAFANDPDGRWRLWRWRDGSTEEIADVGGEIAKPAWYLDQPAIAVAGDHAVFAASVDGASHLYAVRLSDGDARKIETPFLFDHLLDGGFKAGERVYAIARTDRTRQTIVEIDPLSGAVADLLGAQEDANLWGAAPAPRHIAIPSRRGGEIFGFYHAPWGGTAGPPPLILQMHRGPTRMRTAGLDPEIQFFTSRGFAFLDLNYRGSAGYGRAYREALYGAWGVADVEDAEDAVSFLRAQGLASVDNAFIRGKSAGGYSVLQALASSHVFSAGVSYFGIGDLVLLQSKMHKFESGYLLTLVGAASIDDPLLAARSPIGRAGSIRSPLLILQGKDDPVVPPSQAETMAAALSANGVPNKVLLFDGEGHGFRKESSIVMSLREELALYQSVLSGEGVLLDDRQ